MTRTKVIKVRLTEAEYAAVAGLRETAGNVSAVVRAGLLRQRPSPVKKQALRELARIGALLNCVARECRNCQPLDAAKIVAWLAAIDRDVTAIVETLSSK